MINPGTITNLVAQYQLAQTNQSGDANGRQGRLAQLAEVVGRNASALREGGEGSNAALREIFEAAKNLGLSGSDVREALKSVGANGEPSRSTNDGAPRGDSMDDPARTSRPPQPSLRGVDGLVAPRGGVRVQPNN